MKDYFYKILTGQKKGFRTGLLKAALLVLSFVFGAVVRLRAFLFRTGIKKSVPLPCPVISVGNITVGGTGKTPLVIFLARYITRQKKKAVVLTRGYVDHKSSRSKTSDEVLMLKESLSGVPVIAGTNRIRNARHFLQSGDTDVFILDDGMQYLKLRRNLNIVVIDATRPFANGRVLPAGFLREPFSGLGRADLIILTKVDLGVANMPLITQKLKRYASKIPVLESIHKPVQYVGLRTGRHTALDDLKGEKIFFLCSIGNPEAFKNTLLHLGVNVYLEFVFIDHYEYQEPDLLKINRWAQLNNIKYIVTTEKDAVKIKSLLHCFDEHIEVFALKIEIVITQGEDILFDRVHSVLSH